MSLVLRHGLELDQLNFVEVAFCDDSSRSINNYTNNIDFSVPQVPVDVPPVSLIGRLYPNDEIPLYRGIRHHKSSN